MIHILTILFVNISPITISIYGYMEISAELYTIKQ